MAVISGNREVGPFFARTVAQGAPEQARPSMASEMPRPAIRKRASARGDGSVPGPRPEADVAVRMRATGGAVEASEVGARPVHPPRDAPVAAPVGEVPAHGSAAPPEQGDQLVPFARGASRVEAAEEPHGGACPHPPPGSAVDR